MRRGRNQTAIRIPRILRIELIAPWTRRTPRAKRGAFGERPREAPCTAVLPEVVEKKRFLVRFGARSALMRGSIREIGRIREIRIPGLVLLFARRASLERCQDANDANAHAVGFATDSRDSRPKALGSPRHDSGSHRFCRYSPRNVANNAACPCKMRIASDGFGSMLHSPRSCVPPRMMPSWRGIMYKSPGPTVM